MKILLIIVSILLIAIVLLQSGKAEGASNIISGGNDSLFKNRKPIKIMINEKVRTNRKENKYISENRAAF